MISNNTICRIRAGLRLQPQVEVMGVQEAGVHTVDHALANGQRPAVQDPQRGLLVQGQILTGGAAAAAAATTTTAESLF